MKVLFVEYCADDFLGGTLELDPLTELAYRRICDMIYKSNDNLRDTDSLAHATKAGTKWKKIRQELIDIEKIFIENGYIRNEKCTEKLAKSRKNIEQKSLAGKYSAEKAKSLKEQETTPTAVTTTVITAEATNQEPKNPIKEKEKNIKKEKQFSEKFLEFWEAYPRHRRGAKEGAWFAWLRALDDATEDEILAGVKSYAKSEMGQGEFAKGAAAWLNDDRWNWEIKIEDYKHQQHEWPEWKHKLAKEIGKSNVASWFNDAEFGDGVIHVSKQFQAENIRTRFLVQIDKAFNKPFQIAVRA